MSELADGWTWARISDITEKVPNEKPEDYPEKEFGYVDISSICNSTYRITEAKRFKGKDAPSRARRPIRPNDILFSNVRTYLRNIAIVPPDTEAEICSTGFTVLRPSAAVDARFLFRYVLTNNFIDRVTPQQTGTHYPATSDRVVMSELIPLPPLNEQRRIVEVLEELLGKLEAYQKRLSKIPVILKRFGQSVLAAACSGRLTADWRRLHAEGEQASAIVEKLREGRMIKAKSFAEREKLTLIYERIEENDSDDLPDSWRFTALNKLCSSFDYGTSAKSKPIGEVAVLRMGNVQNRRIDWRDLVYTSDRHEIQKYSLKPGTVLFNRTNSPELVGKTAIYRGERPAIFAGYLIRINASDALSPDYLNYCLSTNKARDFCLSVKTDGVSQSNINAQKLGTFEVPFCSLDEQQEIVRGVESLFKLADQIEGRYQKAQREVDKLTQSILAKAFRGELVPTEAELARREGRDYEPASVLLERIRTVRSNEAAVSPTTKANRFQDRRLSKGAGRKK
ncbi:MAG: restriction endonuclease subunit S [Acidobacteriota bacterium]